MEFLLPGAPAPEPQSRDIQTTLQNPAFGLLCDMKGQMGTHANGLSYDCWGYQPADLKTPPDHVWSQFYNGNNPPVPCRDYICGQQNDVLASWGTNNLTSLKITSAWNSGWQTDRWRQATGIDSWQTQPFPVPANGRYNDPAAQDYYWSQDKQLAPGINKSPAELGTCAPSNYPNCDMQFMLNQQMGQVQPWNGWWYRYIDAAGKDINSWRPNLTDISKVYKDSVNTLVHKFAVGEFDALDKVNACDTSDYDPCSDAAFFGKLVPVILGAIFGVFVNNAVFALVPVEIPRIASATWMGTAFGTGFFYGRNAVNYMGDTQENLDYAALVLAAGTTAGTFALFAYTADLAPAYQIAGWVLGAGLGYYFLQAPSAKVLTTAAAPISFVLWLVTKIIDGLSYFLCRLFNWDNIACNNVSGSLLKGCDGKSFPDSRRWDTGGLAYKLTKIACESEGWAIDSPQAEFVYRGLITGPMMMLSATDPGKFPGAYKSVDPAKGDIFAGWDLATNGSKINPLGHITQHANLCQNQRYNYSGFAPFWRTAKLTFNGEYSQEDIYWGLGSDRQHENRYACQNFDIMWGAQEAANPSKDDEVLRDNWKRWLFGGPSPYAGQPDEEGLVNKAYSAYNLMQQNFILGMGEVGAKLLTCKEFLDTCMNDSSGDEGFNQIQNRGRYARRLFSLPGGGCSDAVENTKMRANEFFEYPDISAAWDAVLEKGWSRHNKIALVWYWTDPKALNQADDFYVWAKRKPDDQFDRDTGDSRVNEYLAMPRVEFYGSPGEDPELLPVDLETAIPPTGSEIEEIYKQAIYLVGSDVKLTKQKAAALANLLAARKFGTSTLIPTRDLIVGFRLWALQGAQLIFTGAGGTKWFFDHIAAMTIQAPAYCANPAAQAAFCALLQQLNAKGELKFIWNALDEAIAGQLWIQFAQRFCAEPRNFCGGAD